MRPPEVNHARSVNDYDGVDPPITGNDRGPSCE